MKVQFVALFLSRGLAGIAATLSMVLVGRNVEPSALGILAVVVGVAAVISMIADLGLTTLIPIARAKNDSSLLAAALMWSYMSAAAFSLAGVLVIYFLGLGLALGLVWIASCLETCVDATLGVSVADNKWWPAALSIMARRLITLAVIFYGVQMSVNAVKAYGLGVFIGAVVAIICQIFLQRMVSLKGGASPARLFRETLPFLSANVSAQARALDTSVLALLASASSAGNYAAATRLVQPLYLLPRSLSTVVVPRAARMSPQEARAFARRLSLFFLLLALLLGFTYPLAESAVRLAYGTQYLGAAPILYAALIAFPFVAVASPLGSILQAQGNRAFVSKLGWLSALATLSLIACGAAIYGGVGAAAGVLVAAIGKFAVLYSKVAALDQNKSQD